MYEVAGLSRALQKPKESAVQKPFWPILLWGLIPFVGMCFSVPLWDRITPMIGGLPFNLFWLVLWVPLTSVCLAIANHLHTKRAAATPAAAESDEAVQ